MRRKRPPAGWPTKESSSDGAKSERSACGPLSESARDDRLRDNPQAQHRVADHKGKHRILAQHRGPPVLEDPHRHHVREIYRRNVPRYDRNHRDIPDEARVDDRNPYEVTRSYKK